MTVPIRGVLDTQPPALLSFASSSQTDSVSPADHFVLTFTEKLVCSGYLLDGKTKAQVEITLNFGGEASYTSASEQVVHSCDGNVMKVAAVGFTAEGRSGAHPHAFRSCVCNRGTLAGDGVRA